MVTSVAHLNRFQAPSVCRYVVHAEANALLNTNTSSITGATIYVTMIPCNNCAKLLIQAGISEVVYFEVRLYVVNFASSHCAACCMFSCLWARPQICLRVSQFYCSPALQPAAIGSIGTESAYMSSCYTVYVIAFSWCFLGALPRTLCTCAPTTKPAVLKRAQLHVLPLSRCQVLCRGRT